MMITYRMLDASFVLPICLHGGPVPLGRLPVLAVRTPFEQQFGLEHGIHARRLAALSRRYGATGVVAIARDDPAYVREGELGRIVGLLRFLPERLYLTMGPLCPQDEPAARKLAELDPDRLLATAQLMPRALRLQCLHVVEGYRRQGIGHRLVGEAVAWAQDRGWDVIYADALQPIVPLLTWAGQMSVRSMREHGFTVVGQDVDEGLREAVASQRQGYHGHAVRRIWNTLYADVTDEEAAVRYGMKLVLRETSVAPQQATLKEPTV